MATLAGAAQHVTARWSQNRVLDLAVIIRILAAEYLVPERVPHGGFGVKYAGMRLGAISHEHLMEVLGDLAPKWQAFVRGPPHYRGVSIFAFSHQHLQFDGLGFIRDETPDVVHVLAMKCLTGQDPRGANRNLAPATVSMRVAHRDSAPHPFLQPLPVATLYVYIDEENHFLSGLSVTLNDLAKPYPVDCLGLKCRAEITNWGAAYQNVARTDADMVQLLDMVLEIDPVPVASLGPSVRLGVLGAAPPTASDILSATDRRLRWRDEFLAMAALGTAYEQSYELVNLVPILPPSESAVLAICLSQGYLTLLALNLHLATASSPLSKLLDGLVERKLILQDQLDRARRLFTTRRVCQDRAHSESALGRLGDTLPAVFFPTTHIFGGTRRHTAQCMACRVHAKLNRMEHGGSDELVLSRMGAALTELSRPAPTGPPRISTQGFSRIRLDGRAGYGWNVVIDDCLLFELPLGKAFAAFLRWRLKMHPQPVWDMLTGQLVTHIIVLHHLHESTCGCGVMDMSHARAMIRPSTNAASAFIEQVIHGLKKYRERDDKTDFAHDPDVQPDCFWAAVAAQQVRAGSPLTWAQPKRFSRDDLDLIVDAVTGFITGEKDLADPRLDAVNASWQATLKDHTDYASYTDARQNAIWAQFMTSQHIPDAYRTRDWITGLTIEQSNGHLHHFHGLPELGMLPGVKSRVMCILSPGNNHKEGNLRLHSQSRGKALAYRLVDCLLEPNHALQELCRTTLTSSIPALHGAYKRHQWIPGAEPRAQDLQDMGLSEAQILADPPNPYLMVQHSMYPINDPWYAWADGLPSLPWMQAAEMVWELGGRDAPVDSRGRVVARLSMPPKESTSLAKYELGRQHVLAVLLEAEVIEERDSTGGSQEFCITAIYAAMDAIGLCTHLQKLHWNLGPAALLHDVRVEREAEAAEAADALEDEGEEDADYAEEDEEEDSL